MHEDFHARIDFVTLATANSLLGPFFPESSPTERRQDTALRTRLKQHALRRTPTARIKALLERILRITSPNIRANVRAPQAARALIVAPSPQPPRPGPQLQN
jgi:hypothetical protein